MLLAFDTHWRAGCGADHRDVMGKERVGLLRIDFLVVLRLIHIECVGGAVPHIGLRGHFARIEAG